MVMDDLTAVREQDATEAHLDLRRSVWLPTADGRHPGCEALTAVVAAQPSRVLEVGCGTGEFAARLVQALPDADVVALDRAQRLVDLTARRGVTAQAGDVQRLPFDDASFDVVAALWMLHYVTDLRRGLAEIRRVLRPGGLLVAVTNGEQHLGRLRQEAGGPLRVTGFSSENGEARLREHFADVRRDDLVTRAIFPDHATAEAYLLSGQEDVAWALPPFDGPREYAGHATVFTAR